MIDDVDDAAHGIAAVENGGGAANDFDAFDEQRIGCDGVIGTCGGRVERTESVFGDAETVAAETANNRAARAGAKISGGDAGLAGERFTERRLVIEQ